MVFQNERGETVDINAGNFDLVLRGEQYGLTPVKLKSGAVEWIRASEKQIMDELERK